MPPAKPMPKPGVMRFGVLVMLIGTAILLLGLYGIVQGRRTLAWPRAQAEILSSRVDVREGEHRSIAPDGSSRTERTETASYHVRYRYRVGSQEHVGSGVEPYDFGLQNSAKSREQGLLYPPGKRVEIAYDPHNPSISYLEPGASSTARLFGWVGGVMLVVGAWVRHLGRQGIGRMEVEEPGAGAR